jgi:tetratricopeptide (TPR) repeat protein
VEWWIGVGIVVAVVATYVPVLRFGFVNFDDPEYVLENPHVIGGLTRADVAWAFTAFHAANWHPLTWLSHMVDCQLFGLAPGGHHATNVLLHAGAALLLFVALRRMTGATWRSAAVAALFALHPLRVESVAWISERKDVLAAFCWMLALLAYARWAERQTPARYAAVALAFVAGLLAKPMVVTLPFALLLLDVWPLRRFGVRAVVEKLPLLALAAATSAVVFVAQRAAGAVVPLDSASAGTRIANALLAYAGYLGMTLWPHDLAVFYPYRETFPAWQIAGAAALLVAFTAAAVAAVRRAPWLLVGWLWYLGTLVPVIGFVRAGDQAMADRFTYLPHVGLLVAAVWGVAEATASSRRRELVVGGAAAAMLVGCVVATRHQLAYWRDSGALFAHALAVTRRNSIAHTNYGFALLEQGRAADALAHFAEAVELKPDYAKARLNYGMGLASVGRSNEAIAQYREAIRLDPGWASPHYDLGLELAERGRIDEAIPEYREALRLDPAHAKAHNGLGLALANRGLLDEAVAHYEAALAIDPGLAATHNNLAVALERLGRADDAVVQYRESIRLAPADGRAHFNLGAVLSGIDHLAEAEAEYRLALPLLSNPPEARLALGDVLVEERRNAEALVEYRAALAARPGWPAAESRIAWAIAAGGDPAAGPTEAVRLAEHARSTVGDGDPELLRNLAAAYAAAGRYDDAAAAARRGAAAARAAGRAPLALELDRHVAAYQAGRPVRATD